MKINVKNPKIEFYPKVRYWLPQAAVEENDLRAEIRSLYEKGFGGVEIVPMAITTDGFSNIEVEESSWATEKWNKTLEIVSDETSKLGMTMDVANGPSYPIGMPTVENADDPASLYELTYGVKDVPCHYVGKLPERRVKHEEGTAKLVGAFVYLEVEKGVLKRTSYQDVTNLIVEDEIRLTLPEENGQWKLFAFWEQPSTQKVLGKYYVIDHLSIFLRTANWRSS